MFYNLQNRCRFYNPVGTAMLFREDAAESPARPPESFFVCLFVRERGLNADCRCVGIRSPSTPLLRHISRRVCPVNAKGGSNDDVFFIHFYVSFRLRIVFWKLFFPNQLFPYSFGYRKHSGILLIIFMQQC